MNNTIHLCDTCIYNFAECPAKTVEFGNGKGNDNVVRCNSYNNKDEMMKLAEMFMAFIEGYNFEPEKTDKLNIHDQKKLFLIPRNARNLLII